MKKRSTAAKAARVLEVILAVFSIVFGAICIAGAVALWWEVFEFSMDSFFKMHCQGGLVDTMWDGIIGTLG